MDQIGQVNKDFVLCVLNQTLSTGRVTSILKANQ